LPDSPTPRLPYSLTPLLPLALGDRHYQIFLKLKTPPISSRWVGLVFNTDILLSLLRNIG
ncbi:MAG: hypothetical protein SWX82_34040, partial [Cyanobacteriota bacterium]|nr:hypothetical protein [Cyanobacteriota bacterium]